MKQKKKNLTSRTLFSFFEIDKGIKLLLFHETFLWSFPFYQLKAIILSVFFFQLMILQNLQGPFNNLVY